jgi:hypothetical protein
MDKFVSKLTLMTLVFSLVLGLHLILTTPDAKAACAQCGTTCGGTWRFWEWHTCWECGSGIGCACAADANGCYAICDNADGTVDEDRETCARHD